VGSLIDGNLLPLYVMIAMLVAFIVADQIHRRRR
jgi:hypothetical protein